MSVDETQRQTDKGFWSGLEGFSSMSLHERTSRLLTTGYPGRSHQGSLDRTLINQGHHC